MNELMQRLASWGASPHDALRCRMMGDQKLYKRLLKKFAGTEKIKAFMLAVEAEDYQKAYYEIHQMKGSAGVLSLTPLYRSAEEVISALRTGEREKIISCTEMFEGKFEEFVRIVQGTA